MFDKLDGGLLKWLDGRLMQSGARVADLEFQFEHSKLPRELLHLPGTAAKR